ncbi:MAG: hypothetical protein ABIK61_04985 [candidate division WOR-3 bacterium]
MKRILFPLIVLIIGLWIWLSNIGLLAFHRDWPLLVIIFGIWLLTKAIRKKK